MDLVMIMGFLVSEVQFNKVLEYMEIGKGEVEFVVGGRWLIDGALVRGWFFESIIFDYVVLGARIVQEEIFGSVLSVI